VHFHVAALTVLFVGRGDNAKIVFVRSRKETRRAQKVRPRLAAEAWVGATAAILTHRNLTCFRWRSSRAVNENLDERIGSAIRSERLQSRGARGIVPPHSEMTSD